MADALGDYLENGLLDQLFRSGANIAPATTNIGLFTADPVETFASAAGTAPEISTTATGYGRQAVVMGTLNWTRTNNTVGNVNLVQWSTATANWGTISHVAVLDNSNNLLYHGALNAVKVVSSGDVFRFNGGSPGDLQLSLQ